MKKIYQEPDVELINLVPEDQIANDQIGGKPGVESAGDIFG